MTTFCDEASKPKFAVTQCVRYTGEMGLDKFDRDRAAAEIRRFVDSVVRFEKLGYDMATITEHHFGMFASLSPSPHLALAAAAMLTSKIRLGTAVTVLPFRNPLIVAEEAILLDNLSRGRFELGLGRGSSPIETLPFGLSMGEVSARWKEGLEVLELALTPGEFKRESDLGYANVPVNTTIFPPSYQPRIPVWIGGVSMDSAIMAGRKGYNLMRNVGSTEVHAKAVKAYVEAGQANGHAVTGANIMIERFIACSESADEAAETLGEFRAAAARYRTKLAEQVNYTGPVTGGKTEAELAAATAGRIAIGAPAEVETLFVTGTPKTLAEHFEELMVGTGCNRLLMAVDDRDQKTAELIASQVLPRLRKTEIRVHGL
jgi:alkanesulfonate monooxygenase SsuD/methylene tetrahydromethanopterin reductase-like flavin-dependent oxidoreductase (luciferase family)